MRNLFFLLLSLLFIAGCGDKKAAIDSYQGYITIEINNKNQADYTRFVLASSQGEETFDVGSNKDVTKRFKAVPGTMYNLRAIKGAEDIHVKITDNKGKVALNITSIIYYPGHSGVPSSLLDFAALIYDPNYNEEDPSKYKTGFAKDAFWLVGKTFKLFQRYYEDNGENNMKDAPSCSYDDTFTFKLSNIDGSTTNLSPAYNHGMVLIKDNAEACYPNPDGFNTDKEIPWKIIDNLFLFPIYNTKVQYGYRYNTIIQFTMQKIDPQNGTITFHVGGTNGFRKEIFVYKLVS